MQPVRVQSSSKKSSSLVAFYETKSLFSLVIETVEREEESPVISDLVFP